MFYVLSAALVIIVSEQWRPQLMKVENYSSVGGGCPLCPRWHGTLGI